jgi:hypothetical protein
MSKGLATWAWKLAAAARALSEALANPVSATAGSDAASALSAVRRRGSS